jgi:uncharacterized membrane protein (UPF0127 family)
VLVVAVLASLAACNTHAAAPASSGTPEVLLRRPGGGELRVQVEVARTEAERVRGLMFRRSLDAGKGMLFLFESEQPLKFWMKNTYIPLDMIFIDAQKHVVFVEENATPLTLDSRGPDQPTQFVLEVPGGWCRSHGVGPGIEAQFLLP